MVSYWSIEYVFSRPIRCQLAILLPLRGSQTLITLGCRSAPPVLFSCFVLEHTSAQDSLKVSILNCENDRPERSSLQSPCPKLRVPLLWAENPRSEFRQKSGKEVNDNNFTSHSSPSALEKIGNSMKYRNSLA
jgi:hypothetical protein